MDGRQRMWRLYGWLSGLIVFGSCFGSVTWAARLMYSVILFEVNAIINHSNSTESLAENASFRALAYKWTAAYHACYAIEFLCMSAAQLMVLDRMSDFLTSQVFDMQKWWAVGGRAIMAAVVACNAAGIAANCRSRVHAQGCRG